MRWTDRQHCECETRPVSVWTWVGLAVVVFASTVLPALIEAWTW